jgi:hypothetical protein
MHPPNDLLLLETTEHSVARAEVNVGRTVKDPLIKEIALLNISFGLLAIGVPFSSTIRPHALRRDMHAFVCCAFEDFTALDSSSTSSVLASHTVLSFAKRALSLMNS